MLATRRQVRQQISSFQECGTNGLIGSGNSLGRVGGSSVTSCECEQECGSSAACKSWQWYPWQAENYCYIMDGETLVQSSPANYGGLRVTTTTTPSTTSSKPETMCGINGMIGSGNSLGRVGGSSVTSCECEQECGSSAACKSWQWYPWQAENYCYIMDGETLVHTSPANYGGLRVTTTTSPTTTSPAMCGTNSMIGSGKNLGRVGGSSVTNCECEQECDKSTACKSWQWYPWQAENYCYMMDGETLVQASPANYGGLKATTTTTITTTMAPTTTSSETLPALPCSDMKNICQRSISPRGVQYGGCPAFANEFAASCYQKYRFPSEDYDECTQVIAMTYNDCLGFNVPYKRDDCKDKVCDNIQPDSDRDDQKYCRNIERVCRNTFVYGPVPYGGCPDYLYSFQTVCKQLLGRDECSWQGERLSKQSTGCYNSVKYHGYTMNDCVKAAGC
eukprot:TRINITY_DN5697_c0_g1_i1.p1 TRINITY_DN5697_c0_g1~~TRINITY_DN5697_c0_g1_i1.p1  ORF type:complete len:512 (-),score=51.00 TRINITY_DN5697_c0_g1_i1:43-1389(-)